MSACVTAAVFVAFFALLLAAALQDIRERKVSNRLLAPMAPLWLAWRFALASGGAAGFALSSSLELLAGALAFGFLLTGFTVVAESVSGKYMFGGADIKLLAATTLFVGVPTTLVALFLACMVALLYASSKPSRGIPFAPGVLCGTLLAVLL